MVVFGWVSFVEQYKSFAFGNPEQRKVVMSSLYAPGITPEMIHHVTDVDNLILQRTLTLTQTNFHDSSLEISETVLRKKKLKPTIMTELLRFLHCSRDPQAAQCLGIWKTLIICCEWTAHRMCMFPEKRVCHFRQDEKRGGLKRPNWRSKVSFCWTAEHMHCWKTHYLLFFKSH